MTMRLIPDPLVRLPAPPDERIELARPSSEPASSVGFGEILQSAYDEVIGSQGRADTLINDFLTGGDVDVHEAVIAAEQANLTLSLAVQIRNKAVEAFLELYRIPI